MGAYPMTLWGRECGLVVKIGNTARNRSSNLWGGFPAVNHLIITGDIG
jgi:hypothetical protein